MLDMSVLGMKVEQKFSYSWRDLILYNLSVGAGPDELEYVYEKGLKAVPTFGAVPGLATFGTEPYSPLPHVPTDDIEGLRTDGTLHMDNKLILYHSFPVGGTLSVEKILTGMYDRGEGKGVRFDVEVRIRDEEGRLLATDIMGSLNRWGGGFGGPQPPKSTIFIPERVADVEIKGCLPGNAPLLYRLNGDTFPLHVDPEFAKECGYVKPIAHGLCNLGYACRMMIAELFPGEPERMMTIENQFRNVAFPEEPFTVQVWNASSGDVLFRMIRDSDGKAILDRGRMTWRV